MFLNYITLYKHSVVEIIEKKSKFIATCIPVRCEQEAKDFISEVRKNHFDSSHNVFAYRVFDKQQIERQSDDNEPSGTAGKPILDILRKENIQNSAIVVSRYYGGILLGKGGLVKAYGASAKKVVLASGIIEKTLYQRILINVDYGLSGKIQHEMSKSDNVIETINYEEDVRYCVLVKTNHVDLFIKSITNLCNGYCKITLSHKVYGYWLDKRLVVEDISKTKSP